MEYLTHLPVHPAQRRMVEAFDERHATPDTPPVQINGVILFADGAHRDVDANYDPQEPSDVRQLAAEGDWKWRHNTIVGYWEARLRHATEQFDTKKRYVLQNKRFTDVSQIRALGAEIELLHTMTCFCKERLSKARAAREAALVALGLVPSKARREAWAREESQRDEEKDAIIKQIEQLRV